MFKQVSLYKYVEVHSSANAFIRIAYRIIKRRSNVQKRMFHVNVLKILTSEKHFPKSKSQKEFDYGLLTKLPRVILADDFSLNSFKLKSGILPPLRK